MPTIISTLRQWVFNTDRHEQRTLHFTRVLNDKYDAVDGDFALVTDFMYQLVHLESALKKYEDVCVTRLYYGNENVDAKYFKQVRDAALATIQRFDNLRTVH